MAASELKEATLGLVASLAPGRISRGGGAGWGAAPWRVSRRHVETARAAGTADP
jgi:hypothetical protein